MSGDFDPAAWDLFLRRMIAYNFRVFGLTVSREGESLENGESNLNHLTRHAAQIQQETKSVQTPSSKRKALPIEKTSSKSASVVGISPSASNFEIHQVQLSVESKPSLDAPLNMNNLDVASQSSSSMFDRNAFQQFSQKKLSVIMQNNEYSKLIKFREEMLKFRERREKKIIKK